MTPVLTAEKLRPVISGVDKIAPFGVAIQPTVRKSNRRHGLGMSAGMASATTTTNGLGMEGLNGRVHL